MNSMALRDVKDFPQDNGIAGVKGGELIGGPWLSPAVAARMVRMWMPYPY